MVLGFLCEVRGSRWGDGWKTNRSHRSACETQRVIQNLPATLYGARLHLRNYVTNYVSQHSLRLVCQVLTVAAPHAAAVNAALGEALA